MKKIAITLALLVAACSTETKPVADASPVAVSAGSTALEVAVAAPSASAAPVVDAGVVDAAKE